MRGLMTKDGIAALNALVEVQLVLLPEMDLLSWDTAATASPDVKAIARRAFTRSVFAYVEATTYILKQTAIAAAPGMISEAEALNLVAEKTYTLDNGSAKESNSKLRLPENVRYALSLFRRAVSDAYVHDGNDPSWRAFLRAIKVRDRLMHPRDALQLDVTDEDYEAVFEGLRWFANQVIGSMNTAANRLLNGGFTIESEVRQSEELARFNGLCERLASLAVIKAPAST